MALVCSRWHSTHRHNRVQEGGTEVSATEEAVAGRGVKDLLETDDAKALLDAGREHGQLTADEITAAPEELDVEPAQVDDFSRALEELHIEVVTGEEEAEEVAQEEPREVSTD